MGIQWNSFLQGGFTTTGEVFSVQGRGKIFPVALRIGLVSPRNYSANAKKNIWRANELNIYFQGTIFLSWTAGLNPFCPSGRRSPTALSYLRPMCFCSYSCFPDWHGGNTRYWYYRCFQLGELRRFLPFFLVFFDHRRFRQVNSKFELSLADVSKSEKMKFRPPAKVPYCPPCRWPRILLFSVNRFSFPYFVNRTLISVYA